MPLTPAEVHNVAFKKPPIGKRGYDEEEVDAFLDIVEVELSRLIEENNDLRARLSSGAPAPVSTEKAGGAGDSAAANAASVAELTAAREDNQRLQAHIAELERAMTQGKSGAQQQVVQLQQQLAQTEQSLAENRRQLEQAQQNLAQAQAQAQQAQAAPAAAEGTPSEHHAQAVQMLALAQQTADQHLAQSKAEADRLLFEAQANAKNAVTDAQSKSAQHVSEAEARAKKLDTESGARAEQTLRDAEQRASTITAQFEQRKAALERRVEELRVYEREYRTRLRGYLESQLRDLDASGRTEPNAPAGQAKEQEAQPG